MKSEQEGLTKKEFKIGQEKNKVRRGPKDDSGN